MTTKLFSRWLPALLSASFFSTCLASAATVTWNGSSLSATPANTNWSDTANWTGGTPGAGNVILFTNTAAATVVSNTDNIVDANNTILTLIYGNTTGFHTTLINPGVTLTVTNIASGNLLWVGTASDAGVSAMLDETVTGATGTLVAANTNTASQMVVQQGSGSAGSHMATLDLSGLGDFNLIAGRLLVAGNPVTTAGASNYLGGTLILAKTNTIQLNGTSTPVLNVSDAISNGNSTTNALLMGLTNGLYIDTITIGHAKSIGLWQFNPAYAANNPSLYLRGHSGTRVLALAIGDDSSQTTSSGSCSGVVDFSLGTVNAQVSTAYVGRGLNGNGAGTATGTLNLGPGGFNVNTLEVGHVNISTATAKVTGTVNVNAGQTLVVNTNMALGDNPGASATAYGNLNITNGTVLANSITNVGGNYSSAINLVGGTLVVSNTAGTTATPITTLAVSNSVLIVNGSANAASIAVGTLTFNGTADTLSFATVPATTTFPRQFPVITCSSGLSGAFDFALGSLPSPYLGFISNNTANSSIDLVITNVNVKLDVWNGNVNGNWDASTLNWLYNGSAATYHAGDFVQFDDTLTGTPNVIITTNIGPGACVVTNSTHNYAFSGTGKLSGATGLTKYGSDSLTLTESGGDSFTGGITVNGGTVILDEPTSTISGGLTIATGAALQIGNNDNNGALPAGALVDNGTLIFSQIGNVTLATAIAGTGGLTQNSSGTLTLSVNNSYNGPTTVLQGTLAVGTAGAVTSSSQVNVNNGTIDFSAVTGSATLSAVNTLDVTNATLEIDVPYAQPALSVANLGAGGSANTINISALPPVVTFPTPIVLVQSASPITGANFILGSLPAASPAYSGTLSLSADQTTLYLNVNSGPVGVRPDVVWSGNDASVDTNWSDALNWQEPGTPISSDNVVFDDAAAQSSSALNGAGSGTLNGSYVNNYVDRSFTMATVTYTNIANDYQNTLIASGAILTVTNASTNAVDIFSVGSPTSDFGSSAISSVMIAGLNGALNVSNTNNTFWVGLSSVAFPAQPITLDLSALGTFTADVNTFEVGASAGTTPGHYTGVLYLAQTNLITAAGGAAAETGAEETLSLMVGESGINQTAESYLYLGQTNTFNVNGVGVGLSKQIGALQFNPALPTGTPAAVFRAADGVSPITTWALGDGLAQTGASTSPSGTADFTGGSVNALVATMYLGRSPNVSGAKASTGILNFSAGTISVANLYDGYQAYSNSDYGVGTITLSGPGTLVVSGILYLGQNANGAGAANTAGTLNITDGSVLANSIVAGANGAASTISLMDGLLVVTNSAGSLATPISSFTAGDSVLDLAVSAGATNFVVGSLSVNNTTNNTINIISLPPIYSYPAQIPLISYVSYSPGPTDFLLGSLPAVSPAYTGYSLVNNTSDSTIDLVITSGPIGVSPQVIWSGANSAVDINWSDALNWLQPGNQGVPLSSQSVLFDDLGAAATPGIVDNIVNGSTTIMGLQYGNTNNYHTTLINPGVTLTISNNAPGNLIFVGTGTDNGATQIVDTTIAGAGGTLNVISTNIASEMQIQQGSVAAGNHAATLDLSGLGSFNLTAGRLLVAGNPALAVNASNYLDGTLVLAKTNVIQLSGTNAPALNIADAISNGNTTTNSLELGQTNALFADTITVGRSKSIGSLQFNPALAGGNPALYLRGQTAARVSALAIGDDSNTGETGYSSTGTLDLSLGTVDALVNTCYVGHGQNGTNTGTATGTLTLGAGVFNANTLTVGSVSLNTAIASSTGTVNVNAGGTLVINTNLALGVNPGAPADAIATLNITNGTVLANAITPGTGNVNATINLAGGTLVVSNTAGTPSAPLSVLNLTGGSLQLNLNGGFAATNIVATTVNASGPTTLVLDSITSVATSTVYPLISYTGADPIGGLTLAALPAGYSGTLVDDTTDRLISVKFTSIPGELPPVINTVTTSGGNLIFSGTNGLAGGTFYVLTSTNLTLPLTNWTRLTTNHFSAGGTFSVTNAINPAVPQQFYLISQ